MSASKVIAVVGATGAQGGGLVHAALADPDGRFTPRAITRNPAGPRAQALSDAGAEVVQADVEDEDSLVRAFSGVHGAFCMTNFWEHMSPSREIAQAATMARAAKRAGVSHVVWSTLEDTRRWVPLDDDRMPTLEGNYKVPHYDAKGEANALFVEAGLPVTFFQTSHYWDNMIHLGMGPRRDADGKLVIRFPLGDARLPGIAGEDIGPCAYGVFVAGESMIGQTVSVAGGVDTGAETAASLSRALGEDVRYAAISPDAYRKLGFPGAEELGSMFQFIAEFGEEYCPPRDPAIARKLHPGLQSLDTWLAKHGSRIPLDLPID